jgi:hypothetical protein
VSALSNATELSTTTELAGTTASGIRKLTLTGTPGSPCAVGSVIALKLVVTGGVSVLGKFQYAAKEGAKYGVWQDLGPFDVQFTGTWTPQTVGSYQLRAVVKDGANGTEIPSKALVYVAKPPVSQVNLSASPASPQNFGRKITLVARAIDGISPSYLFRAKKDGGEWYALQTDYSKSNTFTWTPQDAGNYVLQVWAKEKGCEQYNAASHEVDYVINPGPSPTVKLTASKSQIALGQRVTLTWTSTGANRVVAQGTNIATETTSGKLSVTPTTTTTYRIAIAGPAGTASAEQTIIVCGIPTQFAGEYLGTAESRNPLVTGLSDVDCFQGSIRTDGYVSLIAYGQFGAIRLNGAVQANGTFTATGHNTRATITMNGTWEDTNGFGQASGILSLVGTDPRDPHLTYGSWEIAQVKGRAAWVGAYHSGWASGQAEGIMHPKFSADGKLTIAGEFTVFGRTYRYTATGGVSATGSIVATGSVAGQNLWLFGHTDQIPPVDDFNASGSWSTSDLTMGTWEISAPPF